jgi:hypothetical protein
MCRIVCLVTVLTLATEIPRPCFLRLNYYSEMDRYMHCLTAANARWGNGGLVTFFSANSSSQASVDSGDVPIAFKKHRHHTLDLLGALRVSGGLLEFLWNADHQTLEEAFRGSSTQSYVRSREND